MSIVLMAKAVLASAAVTNAFPSNRTAFCVDSNVEIVAVQHGSEHVIARR